MPAIPIEVWILAGVVGVLIFAFLMWRGVRAWERAYFASLRIDRALYDLRGHDRARRQAMQRRVGG